MNVLARAVLYTCIAGSLSACTARHALEQDYPVYLSQNPIGEIVLPTTDKVSGYFLPANTRKFSYEFRSATTGVANLWVVEFGKMLEDTMKSAAVQTAFSTLTDVGDAVPATGSTLVFDLKSYTFSDFAAHITLEVALQRDGVERFRRSYTRDGKGQGGKMFFAGAFGQKNAVQQSTRFAVDQILQQLINDLNSTPN